MLIRFMLKTKLKIVSRAPIHDFLFGGGAPSKIFGGGG
jgi:hypothetical protein